jgi:2-desacetyl-2-hydroxyethyl bacteriochlorophyllide A dehydrogenase
MMLSGKDNGAQKENRMALPKTSANVIFTAKEKAELITEPVSSPGAGQLLVRTTFTLISTGTETICYGRRFDPGTHWDTWVKYPFHTGYSHVGVVEAVGEDVKNFKVGDRVASTAGHGQYAVINAATAYPVLDGVSDRDAAWLTISYIVQTGVRRVNHELGENVAVVGLGPLGQHVIQYTRLLGARTIIAIDPVQMRLDMAKAHGATHTLALGVDQALEPIKELTNGRGVDVVYDMTGNDRVFAGALKLLRRFGKLALIGDTGSPAGQHLMPEVIRNSLQIIASHASNTPPEATDWAWWTRYNMVALFYQYLKDGRMRVSDLNTHSFAPAECQNAYQKLLNDRSGTMGCHFDWSKV